MKITTKWQQDLTFVASNEAGQSITIDGDGKAPSPMHLIAMGVAGCSSIDVVMILKKARQEITDCTCEVDADRAEDAPRVFTKMHAHYKVTGKNLKASQVKRACDLSMEKYCSASLMLKKAVEITHSFEIIEAD
ncbi:OsmC family protein [Aliikangiella marina]|uniref:OsmC family protein n=1 Tax=Aliikangiella marina TaxID=1712262 RepID=A0A545TBP6_9GAMM|nr:OsmC family protein [Aliikangiella marina]TQV74621.1 OsmC family protein [Aliikangiella marina]